MGVFKALAASTGSVLKDQWKEFFYCDSILNDTLMVRGHKRVGENSSNHGDDNVITDGSIVAIADGQCAILVSGGKVTETCKTPGEHELTNGTSPSIIAGSSAKSVGKEVWHRFGFGGVDVPVDQRIYFINTKEIMGNTLDLQIQLPVGDENTGLNIESTIFLGINYSFKVSEPAILYKSFMGNVTHEYSTSWILGRVNTDIRDAVRQFFVNSRLKGVRPSDLPGIIGELEDGCKAEINRIVSDKIGIEVCSLNIYTMKGCYGVFSDVRDVQTAAVLAWPLLKPWKCICGNENKPNAKFCTECGGAKLANEV